jgi:hypothetical protein
MTDAVAERTRSLSHWLIQPTSDGTEGAARLPRLIVMAESAADARLHAEKWRQTLNRDEVAAKPFTDQKVFLARRLPDQIIADLETSPETPVMALP